MGEIDSVGSEGGRAASTPPIGGGPGGTGPPAAPPPTKLKILGPLRNRDFAYLWSGMTISLIGDGIFFVAIPFQVYSLSNLPSALSLVGLAWTLPTVVFLLLGGVISDRFERRRVLLVSDGIRGVAIGILGVLSVAGSLELWEVVALVAAYGAGDALFYPAFGAIVPEIVPRNQLVEANSLDQFVRPAAGRFLGPAVGGLIVAAMGPGEAFILDAVTFGFSALMLMLMSRRPDARPAPTLERSALEEIKEGLRFVRERTWLWGTLIATAIGLLAFFGPWQVLVPLVVKNELGGGAQDYGFIVASGGVGAIVASIVMGQSGLPRRHITFLYLAFAMGSFAIAGYALVTTTWQAMTVAFVMGAALTTGLVIWGTMLHTLVPGDLLGRVSSVDWMVSTAFIPVSFALTGPIAQSGLGADGTLLGAGVVGGVIMLLFLLLPGLHDTERDKSMSVAEA